MSWDSGALRQRIIRGAATTAAGTFTIAIATYIMLLATGRFEYLALVAASTAATLAIGTGVKPQLLGGRYAAREMPIVELIGAGGMILAAEVIMLMVAYPSAAAGLYALATVFGCSITLWGNYTSITPVVPMKTRSEISEKLLTP